jgi:signal transduction histidine kinase
MRTRGCLFFSGIALVAATIINLYLLPPENFVVALYAIAVLIAALHLHPRLVGGIGGLAIALSIGTAATRHESVATQGVAICGLLIVSALAIILAVQRRETIRRASESETRRQQLQAFLGMVAHDLGQPLTSIHGYTQLIARRRGDDRPASERRALLAITDATDRMRRLVDDLRDAARIGTGQFAVDVSPCDLVALVHQIVEEQQATTNRHKLIVEAPSRLEGRWDPHRLGQLCTNLVANAIAYTPGGGDVRIRIQCVAGEAWLSVRDYGIGIAAHERARLFEPFARLTRMNSGKGSGLGLYISKAIVEAHDGRIWVRSDLGRGSTFIAALPLERRHEDIGQRPPMRMHPIHDTCAIRLRPRSLGSHSGPHVLRWPAIGKENRHMGIRYR